ncbi:MAG TPA: serine/threonine-protein kinase [Planctomycetota bacterium]|jgi:serine/threonine protein kinase
MPEAKTELIGQTIGGCAIERLLGSGAMGAVYKGRHLALQKDVAVKILSAKYASDTQYVQRFIAEARLAAQIEHPNIVQVLNVGCENGQNFIVMQFVLGESLAAKMSREGPLPPLEAASIALGIARGLAAAHHRGIIHRDVKPLNVMLTGHGEVKVADLGLAKALSEDEDSSITQAGETMGTPQYMPPEQAADARSADRRSDIYSLGCTIYHMLVGSPPFTAKTAVGVIQKHIQEAAPAPSARRAGVPPPLNDLIVKMMAKEREQRPQTMGEVVLALERICAGTSSASKRRLHPVVIGALAGVLFLLVAGGIVALRPNPARQAYDGALTMWERSPEDYESALSSFHKVALEFGDSRWGKKAEEMLERVRGTRLKAASEAYDRAVQAAQAAEEKREFEAALKAWDDFPAALRVAPFAEKIRAARLKARLPVRVEGFWKITKNPENADVLGFFEPEEVAAKGREGMLGFYRIFRGLISIGADLEGWDLKKVDYSPDMKQCTATVAAKLFNKFKKQRETMDAPQIWVMYQDDWYLRLQTSPAPPPRIKP